MRIALGIFCLFLGVFISDVKADIWGDYITVYIPLSSGGPFSGVIAGKPYGISAWFTSDGGDTSLTIYKNGTYFAQASEYQPGCGPLYCSTGSTDNGNQLITYSYYGYENAGWTYGECSGSIDVQIVSPTVSTTLSLSTMFPGPSLQRTSTPEVGNVLRITSLALSGYTPICKHSLRVFRPAILPESSELPGAGAGWNDEGWMANIDGGAVDYGRRPEFHHEYTFAQDIRASFIEKLFLVLDAPGLWQVQAVTLDQSGNVISSSSVETVDVRTPALPTTLAAGQYPVGGASGRLVGAFYNAGYQHRGGPWMHDWEHMWRPSHHPDQRKLPYWNVYWGAHQVYAMVPDNAGSKLTHDITSVEFARRNAIRIMDVGIDFLIIDDTNSTIHDIAADDVMTVSENLKSGLLQAAAETNNQPVKMVFMLNIGKAAWDDRLGGGDGRSAQNTFLTGNGLFCQKLQYIYDHFKDIGLTSLPGGKPLIILWGAPQWGPTFNGYFNGPYEYSDFMVLNVDGQQRAMTDVFEVRYMAPYTREYPAFFDVYNDFITNPSYWSFKDGPVSPISCSKLVQDDFPVYPEELESVTLQPNEAYKFGADDTDRFFRGWRYIDGADNAFLIEPTQEIDPSLCGGIYSYALDVPTHTVFDPGLRVYRAPPKIVIAGWWMEFGSEVDERNPDCSHTLMDNNKYGTYYAEMLKNYIRIYKR